MSAEIRQFEVREWAEQSARLVQDGINAFLGEYGVCSVMLTGGRSAERLYESWAGLSDFQQMTGVRFYFGDERCVPPDHSESNFGMTQRTLFKRGVPAGCSVLRMEAESADREVAALCYENALPKRIDVLLLGVGDDGHIASLFPGSAALHEVSRRIVPVTGPKPPYERMTITPPVIAQARSIFVLAPGHAKGQIRANALQATGDFDILPVCLVLNATWLLDTASQSDVHLKN